MNADQVFVRREGNVNSRTMRLRYFAEATLSNNDVNILPTRPNTIDDIILNNVINIGVLDVFRNLDNTGEHANNIERLDIVFTQGITAPLTNLDSVGFIQMEKRGNNVFQIAAITSIDGSGNPTAYGNLVLIQPTDYAQTNVTTTNTWFENDAFDTPPSSGNHGLPGPHGGQAEPLAGVFISLQDLGISAGQTIFGYSTFGGDVDTNVHDLLDPSTFPQDTSGPLDVGGNGADFSGGAGGYYASSLSLTPSVGVSKDVLMVVDNQVTLSMSIENFGNVPLTNLSLVDDLDLTFGAGNYTVNLPTITTPPATSTVAVNTGYTGSGADAELLDSANSDLAVGEFAILELTVTVATITDQGNGLGIYFNTAVGAGDPPSGPADRVVDDSTDGPDPDPNGDGMPDENTPTMINLTGNQPPVAAPDNAVTLLNRPVTFSITGNDIDSDGTIDPATVDLDPATPGRQTTFSVAGEGTFTADDAGNVTFTPVAGFTGASIIPYTVKDNDGLSSNAANITVTVVTTPGNIPPVAVNDSTTTPLDTPVTLPVTDNDSDSDGAVDPATVDLDPATPGRQTTFSVAGEGTFTADDAGNVTFTPVAGFTGASIIPYTVKDNDGLTSNEANITVRVGTSPGNHPPVAVSDSVITLLDTPVTFSITGNDSDSNGTIDPATVDLDPATPGRQTTFSVAGQGTFTADDAGNVTFTPVTGFIGTSTIPYTVNDNEGLTSNVANIAVTVVTTPGNIPPVAVNDSATTPFNTPVTLPVTDNDSDSDGAVDPATVDLDPATPGRQTTFSVAGQGTFTADDAGNVTFTPEPIFAGISSIPYTVNDNDGLTSNLAAIRITVDPVPGNIPPVAVDDSGTTTPNTPVTIPVLVNDSDPDGDPLTVTLLTQPPSGTATINPDNTITYTPAPDTVGPVMFPYTITDGRGGFATAVVTVNLTDVFDPPFGLKIGNADQVPQLSWTMVWINAGNVEANAVRVTDDMPAGTTYVADSLICEPRGASTVDLCEFDAAGNRVIYEGVIAPDPGLRTEADAANEVVITYRVTVPPGFFGNVE
ncbi:MAG: Ig-like domain-containing protein, partial [Candidatus Tectomicrobia bacterium]|nr:Ig-like domain-containing protein [Candidatus Tectomicrobia bacterium]